MGHSCRMKRDSKKPQTAPPPQSTRDGPPGASMWLRKPEDVLARIPFAIGFHPTDSLVVIAVNANGRSDLVVRADLPTQRTTPSATAQPADAATTPNSATQPSDATSVLAPYDTAPDENAAASTSRAAKPGRASADATSSAAHCAAPDSAAAVPAGVPGLPASEAASSATCRAAPDIAADTSADVAAELDRASARVTSPVTHRAAPDGAIATPADVGAEPDPAATGDAVSAVASIAGIVVGDTDLAHRTAAVRASGGSPPPAEATTANATTALTADAATAGFGRITTEHSSANPAITAQLADCHTAAPAEDDWPDFAHQLAAAMVHNGATYSILVAYTASGDLARHTTGILATALSASGIGLLDALWVDGSRWRSLSCHDPHCCPAEGKPYDATASRVAAESVYHGEVAFSGEAELRRSIAPTRGFARIAMRRATARMDAEASRRYLRIEEEGVQIASTVRTDGKAFVIGLVERYLTDGTRPTDDEVAWAGMYLYDVHVRDAAWLRMTEQTARQHVQLWREIGRRTLPPYHVAPLALLAFAAWLSGDGPLARCAVDRVLDSDPDYSMARLIREVVAAMVPPSVWPPDDWDWPAESGEAGGAKQPQTD